jgi:hypothetical protein
VSTLGNIQDFIKVYGPTFGVISALLIFALGRISAYKDRKRNFRAYLKVESINANYNLRNWSLKEGSKLIITEYYEQIMNELKRLGLDKDENFIKGTYLGYMRFKNMGPGLIIGGTVNMHMSSFTKTWTISLTLPIMEVGEEIYVSTDNLEAFEEEYYVDEITVIYKTQQNETVKYVYSAKQMEKNPEVNIVTETYFIKYPLVNIYRKKHFFESKQTEWIYLKTNK